MNNRFFVAAFTAALAAGCVPPIEPATLDPADFKNASGEKVFNAEAATPEKVSLFGLKHNCDALAGGVVQVITVTLEKHQLGEGTFETRPGVHAVVEAFTEGDPEEALVSAQAGLATTVTSYVGTGGTIDITELSLAGGLFKGTAELEMADDAGTTTSISMDFDTSAGCTNDDTAAQ